MKASKLSCVPSIGRIRMPLIAALLLGIGCISAQAAQTWAMTHTQAPQIRNAVHLGAMRDGEQVHVAVALKLRNKADLDRLTAQIMRGQHAPISSIEFKSRYAPTEAQVQAVVRHLQANGFTHIEVAPNRLLVSADGLHASIKSAFKTELHLYNVKGRMAYANASQAQVPAELADTVLAVHGLQTVHLHHVTLAKPLATTQAVQAVSPTQFASIYGASTLPTASSATIGIITAGDMSQTISDLRQFASNSGYPSPNVSVVQVGSAGTDTSGTDEWNMDSQSSLATAGGAIKQMLLYTATDLSDAALTSDYNKVVSDNQAKAINVSLGECENDAKSSGIESSNDQIFQSAVAQGQMFSVSSGDSGSYECGGSTSAQSYPAVSPYVMSIGGTTLSSSGGTWQGETVWSCSGPSDCPQSASGGTGGGPSLTEPAPSWQTNAGVLGSSTMRGVPDIAFDAAPSSGALVLINGSNSTIGGTSLAAPIWTGLWARLQSANDNQLPFPAQTLYQGAAAHPDWFHDVTSGGNGGFNAQTGWDYTTGFGSVILANFAQAFCSGTTCGGGGPTASFSVNTSGLTANFTDTSVDNTPNVTITSHTWNFGDGTSSSAANPSHTYAAAGTYTVTESVVDTQNQSASTSKAVTVGQSQQLLGNTGFETGSASPWTLSSGVLCSNSSCSGESAHGGSWFTWLDGYGSSHTDSASQSVAIPSGKSSATLSFYLHIDTAEATTSSAYDKLKVQVTNASGTTTTLATYSNLDAASGYVQKSLDLSSFGGQTVTVKFVGTEDSSLQTSFVLDDITLTVQ